MEVDKKEAALLSKAIDRWQAGQVVDEETAKRLRAAYSIREDNAGVLSVYAFIAAVSCGLLAFGALVMDEKWIELLRRQFGFSEAIVGFSFAALTVLFVYFARKRRLKYPDAAAANEALTVTIVMSVAVAIAYLGRSLGYMGGNYAPILFIAAVCYGSLAIVLKGHLLWITALLGICGWWGAQTYSWSGGGAYFLGMNYALNMTLFGALVWMASRLLKRADRLAIFFAPRTFVAYSCSWLQPGRFLYSATTGVSRAGWYYARVSSGIGPCCLPCCWQVCFLCHQEERRYAARYLPAVLPPQYLHPLFRVLLGPDE